jgi:periplasmic divalent cation tolerance protein
VESDREFLLLMKTSREAFEALNAELEKLHPYDVPEVLALPVVAGSANYLEWMSGNLGAAE